MKMRVLCAVLAMSGILTAPIAHAASGWSDAGSIGEISQQPTGVTPGNEMVFVQISVSSSSNTSGCSVATGFYFPVSTELQKRMFAMLLTAKTSGQNVRVYYTG